MAGKIKIILLFLCLFASNVVFGEDSPQQLTQTADESVNVKMKEVHITLAPTLKLVFPDTSIKINVKHDLGPSSVEADSEYNYLYSKINYMLKYTLNAEYPPAVSLYDDVRFEQIYDTKKYLQRGRGFSLSVSTPYYFDLISLKQEIRRDTYYFASLQNEFVRSEGNMILYDTHIQLNPKKNSGQKILCLCANLEKAIPYKGSPYGFIILNVYLNSNAELSRKINFLNNFEYGYLLLRDNIPLWKSYNLGGYERMAGYKVDFMNGNYKVFYRGKIQWAAFPEINFKFWLVDFLSADLHAQTDIGSAGDVWKIQSTGNYKASLGTGISLYFAYRRTTKVKITLAVAQALEQGSVPVYYLVQEL